MVSAASTSISGTTHRNCTVGDQPRITMTMSTAPKAMARSTTLAATAEIGKTSFGKAIFVTRLELETRLLVPKRMPATKNDQATARTMTEAMVSPVNGAPE